MSTPNGAVYYSYILKEHIDLVRQSAADSTRDTEDDLWGFFHSMLIEVVESQGGKPAKGGDGFFKMPRGEFDVNTAATRLQIAWEAREGFLRDRAENDKSG